MEIFKDEDTTYRYDALDRLIEVKSSACLITYTYDFLIAASAKTTMTKSHDIQYPINDT